MAPNPGDCGFFRHSADAAATFGRGEVQVHPQTALDAVRPFAWPADKPLLRRVDAGPRRFRRRRPTLLVRSRRPFVIALCSAAFVGLVATPVAHAPERADGAAPASAAVAR